MLFDQPRDLPVAMLRQAPPTATARLVRDLRGWWAARYAWLQPRRVPVLVAFLGMLATVQAVDYLANPPAPPVVDAPAAGRVMFKGGQPYRDGKPLGDLPTSTYRVRLVVGQ